MFRGPGLCLGRNRNAAGLLEGNRAQFIVMPADGDRWQHASTTSYPDSALCSQISLIALLFLSLQWKEHRPRKSYEWKRSLRNLQGRGGHQPSQQQHPVRPSSPSRLKRPAPPPVTDSRRRRPRTKLKPGATWLVRLLRRTRHAPASGCRRQAGLPSVPHSLTQSRAPGDGLRVITDQ